MVAHCRLITCFANYLVRPQALQVPNNNPMSMFQVALFLCMALSPNIGTEAMISARQHPVVGDGPTATVCGKTEGAVKQKGPA
jgi:hypothetical protein